MALGNMELSEDKGISSLKLSKGNLKYYQIS